MEKTTAITVLTELFFLVMVNFWTKQMKLQPNLVERSLQPEELCNRSHACTGGASNSELELFLKLMNTAAE